MQETNWWATGWDEANRITDRQKNCLLRYFHYIIPLLTEEERLALEFMGQEAWVDAVGFQRAFSLIDLFKSSKIKKRKEKEEIQLNSIKGWPGSTDDF